MKRESIKALSLQNRNKSSASIVSSQQYYTYKLHCVHCIANRYPMRILLHKIAKCLEAFKVIDLNGKYDKFIFRKQ